MQYCISRKEKKTLLVNQLQCIARQPTPTPRPHPLSTSLSVVVLAKEKCMCILHTCQFVILSGILKVMSVLLQGIVYGKSR